MLNAILLGIEALLSRFAEQIIITLGVQGAVLAIQKLLGGDSGAPAYEIVASDVVSIYDATAIGPYSTEALFFEIQANQTALMDAINGIISGSSPVTISTGSQGDIFNTVWNTSLSLGTSTAANLLQPAGQLASVTLGYLLPDSGGSYWAIFSIPPNGSLSWSVTYPVLDVSTAVAGETLFAAVVRQNPSALVAYHDSIDGHVYCNMSAGTDLQEWVTTIDEAQYAAIIAFVAPSTSTNLPPVWPGLANVTLGSPVALAAGVTITGPLDGVLVSITSVPSYTGLFDFDGDPSYRNVGAITFQSDNGQDELPQTLGFSSAIYCPRQMATASLAKLRTPGAIVGTVTPWVRN